jgi:hypothetical protein
MSTGDFDVVAIWAYPNALQPASGSALVGHSVEATDGGIGKIDEATDAVGTSYLVVDTGLWIFGKRVMLPAGVITAIDADEKVVYLDRSRDEIKHAPPFEASEYESADYRALLEAYYAPTAHDAAIATDRLRKTG